MSATIEQPDIADTRTAFEHIVGEEASSAPIVGAETTRLADLVEIVLTIDLPEGVSIQSDRPTDPAAHPTVVTVDGMSDVTVSYPEATVKTFEWTDISFESVQGSLVFRIRGRAVAGVEHIGGSISFQPCVGLTCLTPRSIRWVAPLAGVARYSVVRALAA
jgi:hypothetical protein